MALGDGKLPHATAQGEHTFVGTDTQSYARNPGYQIHLSVTDLTIAGGFALVDAMDHTSERKRVRESISGWGGLEGNVVWRVAGADIAPGTPISFHMAAVSDNETRFLWRATIGFIQGDVKLGIKQSFYINACSSQAALSELVASLRSGGVDTLKAALTTSMWTKQTLNSPSSDSPNAFYLLPPLEGERHQPAIEWADITAITWDEAYSGRTQGVLPEQSKPQPQQLEFLARAYSMLSAISFLLLAMLAIEFFQLLLASRLR